jgi:hypothetical protein
VEERVRLDLDLLDDEDPFEIDADNRPHLFKHAHYGTDDLLDIYASEPIFLPAQPEGHADWIMVAEIPGEPPLAVPLAPPRCGDYRKARPIGIYPATGKVLTEYYAALANDLGEGDVHV